MNYQIKNMDGLDQAIIQLQSLEQAKSAALKMRLSNPDELFNILIGVISRLGNKEEIVEKLFIHPLTTLLSRLGLPLLLNKTLLKNSNIFVKGFMILASQKAAGITRQLLNSVLDELVSLFQRKSG